MSDEAAFHAAIQAEPADDGPRLVYADWLDDHARHAHAEFLRLWVRARSLPAGGDEFWSLKPRLAALRPADPGWLRQAGCDGHVPAFRHIPEDWHGRWRLVRAFVESWHGIPMPDVGRTCEDVRQLERELGRPLSPSVREWLTFAADLGGRWVRVSPHWRPEIAVERDGSGLQSIATCAESSESLFLAAPTHAFAEPGVSEIENWGIETMRRPPRYLHYFDQRLSTWAIRLVLEGAAGMTDGDGLVVFNTDVPTLAEVLDSVAESRSVFGLDRTTRDWPEEFEDLAEVVWEGPHFFAHAVEGRRLAVTVRPTAPAALLDALRPHARPGSPWGAMAPPGAVARPFDRHVQFDYLP